MPAPERELVTQLYQWIGAGGFVVDVAFRGDPLSTVMALTGYSSMQAGQSTSIQAPPLTAKMPEKDAGNKAATNPPRDVPGWG